jgi:hypothetical protein
MGLFLYSTTLYINDQPVDYHVSRQQDSFLLFKPDLSVVNVIDAPIFWVIKEDDEWKPLNLKNKQVHNQVLDDIRKHNIN